MSPTFRPSAPWTALREASSRQISSSSGSITGGGVNGLTEGGGATLPSGAVVMGGADGEIEAPATGEPGTETPGDVDGWRDDEPVGRVAPGVPLGFGAASHATRATASATSTSPGASRDAPRRVRPMAKSLPTQVGPVRRASGSLR